MSSRIPVSTYRLQFNPSFTFQDARQIVPYLNDLAITDCYASSYLMAVSGSTHGYDVADPTRLNPELGNEGDYRALVGALSERGMGHLLDVVPNHMGIAKSQNPWWLDVLENGAGSRYAPYFDIDWHPVKLELEGKVLLPILGDSYGAVLEEQQLQLRLNEGTFYLQHFDNRLPIAPRSYEQILSYGIDALAADLGADDPALLELQSIITAIRRLPAASNLDRNAVLEGAREKEIVKRRIAQLLGDNNRVRRFVDENVRRFNGRKGDPKSFDLLDALLGDQTYRLASWRVASEEINYRRFFDVNELAAIRMEHPGVFDDVHQLVCRLVREGAVTGLRIDHVDGLYDPREYLGRWQAWAGAESAGAAGERPLYLVVEKILHPDEPLPAEWPVFGTTGYDFANFVSGLFVDARNERALDDTYARFIGQRISWEDLVYQKKKLIMHVSMASEINVLGHQLNRFSERNRHFRDFTLNSLIYAIREIIACFPVYRSYLSGCASAVSDRDRAHIQAAVAAAKRRNPAMSGLVYDFVRDLLLERADYIHEEERDEHLRFIMKFQQTTSPVTAKGIEDTAFYIYNRLISLNEVGGSPSLFGVSAARLHDWLQDRRARWPHALSASSTHDTKRSEDVRARIDVLSEIPRAWRNALSRWSRANRQHRVEVDGQFAPDRNEEYLLYQTLLGMWPFGTPDDALVAGVHERLQAYMVKALREAKVHTSWLSPHQPWEDAVAAFIEAILDRRRSRGFLRHLLGFQQRVAEHGIYNSLSQLLIKIAAPGVPDFYQGSELWDFSLVDPDNRRSVDYASRARLLEDVQRASASSNRLPLARTLVDERCDGRIKLYLTWVGLEYRRAHARLFAEGAYRPLEAAGGRRDHVFAFARTLDGHSLVSIVPRLVAGLTHDSPVPPLGRRIWRDTTIAVPGDVGRRFRNVLTGESLEVADQNGTGHLALADALAHFPVALLEEVNH